MRDYGYQKLADHSNIHHLFIEEVQFLLPNNQPPLFSDYESKRLT